jgi:AraC family transcriptional regulator
MEWIDCMKNALDYIEANLDGDISIKRAAETAASSPFHFQRMFSMLTGMTAADYIRKRRLTLSAQELAAKKCRVIDAALKYGYETPESFSKAFRKLHGISPAQAKVPGAELKAFPKLSFHISITGGKDMDYRIGEKRGFEVAGAVRRISTKDGVNFNEVPAFWQDCEKDGTCEKICAMSPGGSMYGLCLNFAKDQTAFDYMIAADAPEGELPKGFKKVKVPAAAWAVFTAVGKLPEAIQDVTKRIFSEWFPATGYEHDDAPEIEVYPEGDTSSPDYRCEIWIPVKKK